MIAATDKKDMLMYRRFQPGEVIHLYLSKIAIRRIVRLEGGDVREEGFRAGV